MYGDSTPVVANRPSCACRGWPPAPGAREGWGGIEPDPDSDDPNAVPYYPVPCRRNAKPTRVRTYITAQGVVRIADPTPAPMPKPAQTTGQTLPARRPLGEWREEV